MKMRDAGPSIRKEVELLEPSRRPQTSSLVSANARRSRARKRCLCNSYLLRVDESTFHERGRTNSAALNYCHLASAPARPLATHPCWASCSSSASASAGVSSASEGSAPSEGIAGAVVSSSATARSRSTSRAVSAETVDASDIRETPRRCLKDAAVEASDIKDGPLRCLNGALHHQALQIGPPEHVPSPPLAAVPPPAHSPPQRPREALPLV
eukprot:CAMPEP_0177513100 /NCGR_PEP_ID=MMETSP0369-20130122/43587_1 /TAXON_ID=447022 ORGANISM="Scrippsiella hangoei-like, Strain SHHI-4" /NCGR_SAMPLE_ID=MMETSP0369 /ASSEMBLY_ACC=CAM_ASM_000364 /LENGTH=211 /DNA_ID=CAMNT_0018991669 /DNA_START=111 /DNA_END=745 /DNA_ORIENTATION=-